MLLSDLAKDASLKVALFVQRHPEPILVSWSSDDDESPVGFHTPDGGSGIRAFSGGQGNAASDHTPRDHNPRARNPHDHTPPGSGTPIPDGDLEDETEVVARPRSGLLGSMGSNETSGEHAGAATAVRPAMDLVCVPLIKSDRNPFTQMVTAGRTPNNDVILRDASVSKFHAYFAQRGTTWWLHDQSSTNGTFAARSKVTTAGAPLSNGMRVAFGERLFFRFFTPAGIHALLNQG